MHLVKVLLLILNVMFFVGGGFLIAAAINMDEEYKLQSSNKDLPAPRSIIIMALSIGVTGIVATVVACIGCGGILKEVNFLIMAYGVFMSIFLLVQIALALQFAHIHRHELRKNVYTGLKTWITSYSNDSFEGEEFRKSWDSVQSKLNCCGIFDFTDWEGIQIPKKKGVSGSPLVPRSCCRGTQDDELMVHRCTEHVDFNKPLLTAARIYTEGCLNKAVDDYRDEMTFGILGFALICFPVIEFLAFFFSCLFSYYILHGDEEEDDDGYRRRPSEFCFYPQIADV